MPGTLSEEQRRNPAALFFFVPVFSSSCLNRYRDGLICKHFPHCALQGGIHRRASLRTQPPKPLMLCWRNFRCDWAQMLRVPCSLLPYAPHALLMLPQAVELLFRQRDIDTFFWLFPHFSFSFLPCFCSVFPNFNKFLVIYQQHPAQSLSFD